MEKLQCRGNKHMFMSDFNLLLQWGNLGFYSRCEITNIFIIDKVFNKVHNLFSIFVMEDNSSINSQPKNITPKLVMLSERFSLGIKQFQVTTVAAGKIYENLLVKECDMCDFGQGNLHVGQLKPLAKQFAQQNSTIEPALNKIIKNNYRNGSYILEFFDMVKPVKAMLTTKEFRSALLKIQDFIPIDLFAISDRVGNIIFQFPAQVMSVSFSPDKDDQFLELDLHMDKRLHDIKKCYCAIAHYSFEDVLVGHNLQLDINANDCKLLVGDTSGLNCVQIIDQDTGLIVYMSSTSFMAQASFNLNIQAEERTVRNIKISIHSRELFRTPPNLPANWKDFTRKRQHQASLKKLESEMKFIQYGINGPERERAVKDVQQLIQRRDPPKIYLWDPYLTANDILDTLYFSQSYGAELRAISSSRARNKPDCQESSYRKPISKWLRNQLKYKKSDSKVSISEWLLEQKNIFETQSNNSGVNLVFRLQHGNYGFPFHDRFLIFINDDDVASVWSLGTSVNSLGKEHHILQEVNNPQYIADAFERLWEKLDNDNCLVWSSNN